MGNPFDDIINFNKCCEVLPLSEIDNEEDRGKALPTAIRLVNEEYAELTEALFKFVEKGLTEKTSTKEIAKEGIDLIYVTVGLLYRLGIPVQEVFDEVHNSNMTKLVDFKPVKREDGKVLKGPNYIPPDLDKLNLPEYKFGLV